MEPVAVVEQASALATALEVAKVLYANYSTVLGGLSAVASVLILVFLPIKGEQPEKALQAFVNFVAKFSKK